MEERPGAFDYATPLRQWRTTWPAVYETLLAQLRRQWPEGRGIREFVTILQLHQHHSAELIAAAIPKRWTITVLMRMGCNSACTNC